MPTYCLFDILEITDENAMKTYREKVQAVIEKYKGRYVVIGGPCLTKEGRPEYNYPVLIEFPDMLHAERWYNSPEYKPLQAMRKAVSKANVIFFQGI